MCLCKRRSALSAVRGITRTRVFTRDNDMNADRRKFLKQTGWTLLGSGILVSVGSFFPAAGRAMQKGSSHELYGFIVDTTTVYRLRQMRPGMQN